MQHSRRWLIAALLSAAAAPVLAEAPARSIRPPPRPGTPRPAAEPARAATPGPDLGRLVEAAKLGGATGLVVIDAASGRVIEGLNADRELPPASVAKAMTSLYAIDRLGTAHRWTTRVIATGPVAGGAVQGDLVLAGMGDPTLSTDHLGDMAAALAARGIRGVTGRFLIHAGALPRVDRIDDGQPAHVGYNPTLSGMILNYNRVHFEWKRNGQGWALTMDARGERFVPQVGMATMRAVNREAPLFTYAKGQGTDDWTVAAAALGKGGARWLPVRHPELYAGDVFRTLCAARGLRLPAPRVTASLPGGTVLAQVQSDSLVPILRDMLRYSTNITAEAVGLTASRAGSLRASGSAMTDWARSRYATGGRFVDHSGLGGAARISAIDMARALARGAASGLPSILREHGMRDAKGNTIKGHPVRVLAKTGTLNFVSGLAGYIQPPNGRSLVFAIFSADVARRDGLPQSQREQPPGGPEWTRRARGLQAQLVSRWAALTA
ncbi:MAG: D-alanyl-D-alanine carboxypeptidase/D-alanyl-D-alanine-endopeptidase [Paracoccaceae bacterium]|nr:MAG: D-alanyl-D-alanine carboxypeptidase/D-alanyl-D-alanine-endopeptidase [Paracoccaceae bacterium]